MRACCNNSAVERERRLVEIRIVGQRASDVGAINAPPRARVPWAFILYADPKVYVCVSAQRYDWVGRGEVAFCLLRRGIVYVLLCCNVV